MPRLAVLLAPLALVVAVVATSGCAAAIRCDALTCAPACPRDAARDGSGRCVCVEGTLPLLGACVPPAVGDAFCGPAAVLEPDGCVFRACPEGGRVDVVTGGCLPRSAKVPGASPDATCPRGARRAATSATCERSPRCPPGSLVEGSGCRAIVTSGGRLGDHRVDVGAWAALVLGFDGGDGSRELCQPLQQNAESLGLPGDTTVEIAVSVSVPDQDIARVRADVDALVRGAAAPASGGSSAPDSLASRGPAGLQRFVAADVGTLIEALRGLGGQAAAAAVDVRVRCALGGSLVTNPSVTMLR